MDVHKISEKRTKITLEDVTRRKQEVLEEIRLKQNSMGEYSSRIFAPFLPSADGSNSVMKKFNTGLAIFDGFMVGMRLIKRLRKLFGKNKY